MLEVRELEKSYGALRALKTLSLQVPKGSLFGLMGQNGAGKTTLLRTIAGVIRPEAGAITIDGVDALRAPMEARALVGYVPDYFGSYENLTVLEYMDFFAAAFGLSGRNRRVRCQELMWHVGLSQREDMLVDHLSRGMQQRLSIARALIHNPEYLILDEPTSGLDPGTRVSVREMLCELCDSGKTILISSHVLSELSEICTDIAILDKGVVKVTGEVSGILKQIEHSNPLKITVLDGTRAAMAIFRKHPCVRSLTLSERTFSLEFEGSAEDEAALLQQLIDADIPVHGFMRDAGSLESFFLQMTEGRREQVIQSNVDESDL